MFASLSTQDGKRPKGKLDFQNLNASMEWIAIISLGIIFVLILQAESTSPKNKTK